MRRLFSLLAAFVLAVTLLTAFATPAAHANPRGCRGPGTHAKWKFNYFDGADIPIKTAQVDPRGTASKRLWVYSHYRAWGDTKYIYCHDNFGHNRMKPMNYKFCVRRLDNVNVNSANIRGWWFDPYFGLWDGDAVVNPAQVGFHWNGKGDKGDTHCTDWYTIAWEERKWLRQSFRPYWVATGHVDLIAEHDKNFKFVQHDSRFRMLNPHRDVTISR